MVSPGFSPTEFLAAVGECDLLRLQSLAEEELRQADTTCRRAWNEGRSVPPTAPRYLNFLKRLIAWLDTGGQSRARLAPEVREPWRALGERLVAKGQLDPVALRSLGPCIHRTRGEQHAPM